MASHCRIARTNEANANSAPKAGTITTTVRGWAASIASSNTPKTANPGGNQLAGFFKVGQANQSAARTSPIRPLAEATNFTLPVF